MLMTQKPVSTSQIPLLSAVLYLLSSKCRLAKTDIAQHTVLSGSLCREQTTWSLHLPKCTCMGGCLCYLRGKAIWQNTMVRHSPRWGETYLGMHPTCWYANLICFSHSPLRNTPLLIFHRCFCKKARLIRNEVSYWRHSPLTSKSRFCLLRGGKYPAEEVPSRKQSIYILMYHCAFLFLLASSVEHSSIQTHTHNVRLDGNYKGFFLGHLLP